MLQHARKVILGVFLSLNLAGLSPVSAENWLDKQMTIPDAVHLLLRTGIGAAPGDIANVQTLTRRQGIEWIIEGLNNSPRNPMPDWVNHPAPNYWARGDMDQSDKRDFNTARDREIVNLRRWWIREMIETTSPQTERLVLLWHNHFVSGYASINHESTSIARQNQLFRSFGAGNYRQLLREVLRDAAMLNYLDNRSNKKRSPNENLAREFLELFTLGEGTFAEQTVKEAARALTGWTVSPAANMTFVIDEWQHDSSEKTLFGLTGKFDGDDLIDLVLNQPSSSVHIARRFWNAYISEMSVDDDAVQQLADAFRASGFELKALLRATMEHPVFWRQAYRGTIIKSPVDLLIGTVRSTGYVPEDWQTMPSQLSHLGQNLFEPPNVAGWPGAGAWVTPAHLYNRNLTVQQIFGNRQHAATEASNSRGSMMEMMPSMISDSSDTSSNDLQQGISVKLAAENYQGPVKYQVALKQGDQTVWSSAERAVHSGVDTERYGRPEGQDLPWHTIPLINEDVTFTFDRVEVTFLNDKAGATGDRNLFVDWVVVNNHFYFAADGRQFSSCPPENRRAAGNLYCEGSVQISNDSDVPHTTASTNASTGTTNTDAVVVKSRKTDVQVDNVYVWWLNNPQPGKWRELVIGLLGVTYQDRHWNNVVLNLVDSPHYGFSIEIKSTACWPDCVSKWPPCSWNSKTDRRTRYLLFPVRPTDDEQVRCHWESLAERDKQFIGALYGALPDIVTVAEGGERAHSQKEAFSAWKTKLEKIGKTVKSSRYRAYATAARLVSTGNGDAVITASGDLSTPRVAGQTSVEIKASLEALLTPTGNVLPASILLTTPPLTANADSNILADILGDPAYQVR